MKIKFPLLLLLVILTQLSFGQSTGQTTLFDFGSSWKYLDNNSNQGTAWRAVGFNDAAWITGTGYFGYGDPWITTCVNACGTVNCSPSCGTKYITTYFRKIVNIPNPALYDSVKISAYRDDGIVVYVNGTEVWRSNMPTGTISVGTLANSPAIGGADETTAVSTTIPISAFTTGDNTIAVEVHQQDPTSSDLTFNMQMIATSAPIVAFGSSWKYQDNGVDQGTTWRGTTFNDASWASGTGFLGYGDPWINTCIHSGAGCPAPSGAGCAPGGCTKYPTAYFRKVVTLPSDLSRFDGMQISACRDDGIVVFVNGTEVWRDNMPTGTISFTTLANSPAIDAPAESTAVVKFIPISAFTTGTNTIAVEIHQQALTSSDLTFNFKLDSVRHVVVPVTLSQGPYLNMGNQSAITVRWRTNVACKSRVLIGTTVGTYPIIASDATAVTEHIVRVPGLTANTKYFYEFGTDTSIIQGDLNNFFTTAPADTSTREVTMAVFGDCGRNDNNFQTGSLSAYQNYLTNHNMKASDLMLIVGDNAYDAGLDAEFTANFFSRYSSNILKNHILFPCPGNHDYANDASRQVDHNIPYYSLFSTPSAGECGGVSSGNHAYYSYDWGNVHVLSLDSYGEENAGTTRLYDTLGAQVTWIKNDLAANTKKWVIVYFHHAPFTLGGHNSDTEDELVKIRQNFVRILERYGVDMVICGHTHAYERSYLLKNYFGTSTSFNKAAHTADSSSGKYDGTTQSCPYTTQSGHVDHGTVYVVSGSSGADGSPVSGWPMSALPFTIDDGGMFFLDIKNNRLDAKFLRRDNSIGDQFTIMKDTKAVDTVKVFPGTPVNIKASWQGAYVWNTGATTPTITVTSQTDTLLTVKDSATHTCIIDKHFIDIQCTTPGFTSFPLNVTRSACDNVVTYSVSDTATPSPTLTYAFTGATTGTGSGTGSGASFNPGNTFVTITATNTCGPTSKTFTVTVNQPPAAVTVSGGGTSCDHTTLIASNGSDGTIYYQGISSGGTDIGTPLTSKLITSAGTYYFRARGTDGCWGAEGSATVAINPLPVVTFTGQPGSLTCANIDVSYTTQAGMNNYTWAYPDATVGTDYTVTSGGGTTNSSVTLKWKTQNTRTVSVNYKDGNTCTAVLPTTSDVTTVISSPATITGNTQMCAAGSTITLHNAANGGTWSTSSSLATVNSTTGVVTPGSAQGTLSISYVNGCGTPAVTTATVNATPSASTGNMPLCANGSSVTLANTATNGIWSGGTAGIATVNSVGVVKSGITAGTTVIKYSNGCGSMAATTVTVNPLPVIHTFTGGGGYCNGDAGVPVGLTLTEEGVRYQLYLGATTVGGAVNGTGAAIGFGTQSATGVYHAVAVDTATSCTSILPGVTISINPLPDTFTVTGGGNYCSADSGAHVSLAGSESGVNYQLYKNGILTGAGIAGTGSPLDMGLHTAAGMYTVIASNNATHCVSNMSDSVGITIISSPGLFTVTGGGAYCATDSGIHVKINGSDAGVQYQLYLGSSSVGSTVTGTGAILDLGLQTAEGTYTVAAIDPVTNCRRDMTSGVIITINPAPANTYHVTGGGSYCTPGAGMSIGLSNSDNGVMYRLSRAGIPIGAAMSGTNAPLDFGPVAISGTYNVIATDPGTGCKKIMSDNAVISPMSPVVPTVNISTGTGNGNIICPGNPASLTALTINGGGAPSYVWTVNGATVAIAISSYSYMPANGDVVKVDMHSTAPCATPADVSGTMTISVDAQAVPSVFIKVSPITTIAPGEWDTLTAVTANCGQSPKYQWYRNATKIEGATTTMYENNNFANHDSLSCRVIVGGICNLETSNSVIISVYNVGVSTQSTGARITLVPNPNKGTFTISGTVGTMADDAATIEITNMFGQVIYKKSAKVVSSTINEQIQLNSKLANGMYLLNLHTANGNTVIRFVIEQ